MKKKELEEEYNILKNKYDLLLIKFKKICRNYAIIHDTILKEGNSNLKEKLIEIEKDNNT